MIGQMLTMKKKNEIELTKASADYEQDLFDERERVAELIREHFLFKKHCFSARE